MARVVACLLLAAFLSATSSGLASSQAAPTERMYRVEARLMDGNRLIGAPSLIVRDGEPMTMMMTTGQGYSIRLAAEEAPVSDRYGRRVSVKSDISFRVTDRWAHVASPQMTMPFGKAASYELAASARTDRSTEAPFRFEVTVSEISQAPAPPKAQ